MFGTTNELGHRFEKNVWSKNLYFLRQVGELIPKRVNLKKMLGSEGENGTKIPLMIYNAPEW